MKRILTTAASLLVLVSCQSLMEEFQPVFTGTYDAPSAQKYYSDADFGKIITIAELASQYTPTKPFTMPGDNAFLRGAYVRGRVSTTDQPGNFYKSFFIQDETGGMEIKIGKNSLYNDYLPGQTVYVKLNGLTLGMYGFKTGNYGGMGMTQIGFTDPSGEYETSYLEIPLLIDYHIFRGSPDDLKPVIPVVVEESELPDGQTDTQATNANVGRLVTLKGLKYANEVFCLLYLDSNKDKKSYTNRIFLSDTNGISTYGKTHGVTTLAMSKNLMREYICSGIWDECKVGSGNEYVKKADGSDCTVKDLRGDGSYPAIEKAAYSVSQYFTMGSTEIQIRTSGFCKFADYEIPADVLDGSRAINVTGVINLYQGGIQLTVNSAADFTYEDGTPLYK